MASRRVVVMVVGFVLIGVAASLMVVDVSAHASGADSTVSGPYVYTGEHLMPLSRGARQVGEEILEGLTIESGRMTIKVGSNGCTNKGSFRVGVKAEPGITERCPHYVLTIYRLVPDECKMIVYDPVSITFDLEEDLGLTGLYTFCVTNRVYSAE